MKCCSQQYEDGHYVLPPLPYPEMAPEALIDAETVRLHHDRHQAAYVAGANAATEKLREIAAGRQPETNACAVAQELSFCLGGALLHRLYWLSISPEPTNPPEGALADELNTAFGSYMGFLRLFRGVALGIRGDGWAVLGAERASGHLVVLAVRRHESGLVPGFRPLVACDVWEHAYYLRYHNNRAAYVDAFLNHINWAGVAERLSKLKAGGSCHVR